VRDSQSAPVRIRGISALLAVIALWGQASPSSAEEVYKSVDAQGHVVYSDRSTSANARKSEIRVSQPDAAQAARNTQEQQILDAEDNQRKQREALESREASLKAQKDQQKRARCAQARDHYNFIKDVSRLYHLDPDGNRVYYTDAEVDARREQARQAMVGACDK
jgi:tRNA A37 threonylcarbamoyladenosine modification protein TsaB